MAKRPIEIVSTLLLSKDCVETANNCSSLKVPLPGVRDAGLASVSMFFDLLCLCTILDC